MKNSNAPVPKPEHPRPDFQRREWLSLNGTWDFNFEDVSLLRRELCRNQKEALKIAQSQECNYQIEVPFAYQSPLSKLQRKSDGTVLGSDQRNCEVIWYRRELQIAPEWQGKRILLHFEAVDYQSEVWLNGQFLELHRGGHVPFVLDLGIDLDRLRGEAQKLYQQGHCELLVKVYDPLDPALPRGKQSWESPAGCWYMQSSGIWQTVWLEAVSETYLVQQQLHCNFDAEYENAELNITLSSNRPASQYDQETYSVTVQLLKDKKQIASTQKPLSYPITSLCLKIANPELWSPENPALYNLIYSIESSDGKIIDRVESYTGLRHVSLSRHGLLLNGKPYYQRLVLDQGFWPDGRYTAPSDNALKLDIELAKAAGFNGCRKHMKVEEARFLYWADKLGFLVWGEFPAPYVFTAESRSNFLTEWPRAVERDRNHPSIVAWTPYNESWGIGEVASDAQQQAWLQSIYQLTKQLDPSRPVIDNDGWEHVHSDIYTYHTYNNRKETLSEYHNNVARRSRSQWPEEIKHRLDQDAVGMHSPMMAGQRIMPEMPRLISEFGGIGYIHHKQDVAKQENDPKNSALEWGYADLPESEADFKHRFEEIMSTIYSFSDLCGFCYTQLTDVDQEINGILNFDRTPKFDLNYFKEWFGREVK